MRNETLFFLIPISFPDDNDNISVIQPNWISVISVIQPNWIISHLLVASFPLVQTERQTDIVSRSDNSSSRHSQLAWGAVAGPGPACQDHHHHGHF